MMRPSPSIEDQAFDRAHRMGQMHDVNIYKLSIENVRVVRALWEAFNSCNTQTVEDRASSLAS
jgi:SNF2 family DNA or RNA helicase